MAAVLAAMMLTGSYTALTAFAIGSSEERVASASDASSSDASASNTIHVEDDYYTLPEPERDDYIFVEWNTELDSSGDTYYAGEEIEIADMQLYAIWETDKEVKIASGSDAEKVNEAEEAENTSDSNITVDQKKIADGTESDTVTDQIDNIEDAIVGETDAAGIMNEPVTSLTEEVHQDITSVASSSDADRG